MADTALTPWSRWILRCTLACLLVALAGCKVSLYSNLAEDEANTVVNALAADGVKASKSPASDKGWEVAVAEEDVARSLEVLRANDLPGDRYVSMAQVFQRQGLVSTPSEERMRYVYAVSQELAHTLRKIDGVVAARVHVVIPQNDPLNDKVRPASAAVFIKHKADMDLPLLVPAVKQLVAHSIEGLSYDNVALSLFEVRKSAARPLSAPPHSAEPVTRLQATPWMALSGLLVAGVAGLLVVRGLGGQGWGGRLRQRLRAR